MQTIYKIRHLFRVEPSANTRIKSQSHSVNICLSLTLNNMI
jgi:hypothetical protein